MKKWLVWHPDSPEHKMLWYGTDKEAADWIATGLKVKELD